jgi:HK97 gp10 family phage protein
MKTSIRIEGFDQLARNLRNVPKAFSNRLMKQALIQGGEPIRQTAASTAPRAPGAPDLADHIVVSVSRREQPGDVAVGVGPANERRSDTGANYGVQGFMLETGTARMQARPFLRAAFLANVTESLQIVRRVLWEGLIRAGVTTARGGGVTTESFRSNQGPSISGGPGGSTL